MLIKYYLEHTTMLIDLAQPSAGSQSKINLGSYGDNRSQHLRLHDGEYSREYKLQLKEIQIESPFVHLLASSTINLYFEYYIHKCSSFSNPQTDHQLPKYSSNQA